MKFTCPEDHFYKVFIERILSLKPTYLIQDYLQYVQLIHFNSGSIESPSTEMIIKCDDVGKLQNILSERELNKMLAHRFVDALKKLLQNKDFNTFELNARLGEYREHLLNYVQKMHVDTTPLEKNLALMEDELAEHFKTERNEALSNLCQRFQYKNEYQHSDDEENSWSSADEQAENRTINDDNGSLDFLTHNRNLDSSYKSAKDEWDNFTEAIRDFLDTKRRDTESIRKNIVLLHKNISSTKLEYAASMEDIENILTLKPTEKSRSTLANSQQTDLQSAVIKIVEECKQTSLLNNEAKNRNSGQYSNIHHNKIKKRLNTINNYLFEHMDRGKGSRSFNINQTFRLMFYTEMYILLDSKIRNGGIKNSTRFLIEDYTNMIEIIQKHLSRSSENNGDMEVYSYMKQIVFNDMFGTAKIDAANMFFTTMKKMEEILSVVLNNSNYNYAALSTVHLINDFISSFNNFLQENEKLNRNINEASTITSSDLPELDTLKNYGHDINDYTKVLRNFTKKFPLNTVRNDLILNTFNGTNIFEKKK